MTRHPSLASVLAPLGLVGAGLLLAGCEPPPNEAVQIGYRGVGMELVYDEAYLDMLREANVVPEPQPSVPAAGPKAGEVYENVQVLGHLSVAEFGRFMAAITEWVSPEQGCNYCHIGNNLASDDIYTKRVSRRMIQMTMHVNENWSDHVADTGVTCYTCHRGQNVPAEIWFEEESPFPERGGLVGNRMGQNHPSPNGAYASLPYDPFTPYLVEEPESVRIQGGTALPVSSTSSIQATEKSYSLMMHFSDSLGVNCTYCHNSRSWGDWAQSTPQRVTAWHGLQMVRDLNVDYLVPLGPEYPENRLGPLGDAPKTHCATCHQGAYKPLLGQSMLADYPSLKSNPND